MITVIHGEQRTDEWHKMRLAIPTASDFSTVMVTKGKGPGGESTTRKNLIVAKAVERITGIPAEGPDFSRNKDVQNGVTREATAVIEFELATQLVVDRVAFVRDDDLRAGASPDGLIDDDSGLEIKCPNQTTHLGYLTLSGRPPAAYEWQVYGSMLVTGRSSWWFCSFNPEMPVALQVHFYKVVRDEVKIDELRIGIAKFNAEVDAEVKRIEQMIRDRELRFAESPDLAAPPAGGGA